MAFKNAQASRVIVGQVPFSAYTRNVSIDETVDMLDTTTIVDTAKAFIVGQDTSTFTLDLILDTDTTTNGEWDRLTAAKALSAALPVTFAPSGLTALSEAFLIGAREVTLTTKSQVGTTVDATLDIQTDGQTDHGIVLEDFAAATVDANGTARNLTAQSTNGGVGHIHVSAFSGLTSNAVTIQDSSDGASGWGTILTFTTITGVTSERVAITGTVKQYLRVVDDVTGSGSCTRQVSFARR